MKEYELKPIHDSARSFYGKATVTEYSNRLSILTSYKTEVAAIKDGHPVRLWDGYSATTQRHINEYFTQNGISATGKAEWLKLKPQNVNSLLTDIIIAVKSA